MTACMQKFVIFELMAKFFEGLIVKFLNLNKISLRNNQWDYSKNYTPKPLSLKMIKGQ